MMNNILLPKQPDEILSDLNSIPLATLNHNMEMYLGEIHLAEEIISTIKKNSDINNMPCFIYNYKIYNHEHALTTCKHYEKICEESMLKIRILNNHIVERKQKIIEEMAKEKELRFKDKFYM